MLYATNAQDPIPVPSSAASGAAATTAIVPTNEHLERVKKSQFILEKYPDRVPLIITPSKTDRNLYPIDKSKYITPRRIVTPSTTTNHPQTHSVSPRKGSVYVY